jgi:putative glutamine amidotransferase
MKRIGVVLLSVGLVLSLCSCGNLQGSMSIQIDAGDSRGNKFEWKYPKDSFKNEVQKKELPEKGTIGIAWRADPESEFYTNITRAIEEAGGSCIMLPQIKTLDLPYDENGKLVGGVADTGALTEEAGKLVRCNSWQGSDVAEAIDNVGAVVFTGGEDISPSLYYEQKSWHGIEEERDYNAERDVSDYLLMSYCLEQNIPVMGFCRGMQMLSVVSGAEIMQDIPTWFEQHEIEYDFEHRNRKTEPESYRDYAPHDVQVRKDSILYEIIGTEMLIGCPSWHHQALENVDNTRLCITGSTETNGVEMIEAVERTDKDFAIGLQFHPEASIVKHLESAENADSFMEPETAVKFFERLIEEAAGKKPTADQDIEEMWQDMEDGLSDAA